MNKILILALSLLFLINHRAKAEQAPVDSSISKEFLIYHFELKDEIMPAAWRLVNNAIQEAENQRADIIIMELNTYGGRVDIADSIRTAFINAVPTSISWINNNAASAGALISIACDSIYMANGANMGAATVVDQTGAQAPDKYQSYMRSTMRSTAEAQGRNPKIAEAMVDDRIKIEGIIDSGQVLTFTTSEAIENNFCEGEANSIKDIIKHLKIDNYKIVKHEIKPVDKIISFLLNPLVSSIIMLLIFGGIYFELQTPGVGFPLAAAAVGAILYFAPLYLEGLAANWEILLFVIGLILIALEIFVIPGTGVAGIIGALAVIAGLTLSLVENNFFDFQFTPSGMLAQAFFRVAITLFTGLALMLFFGKSLFNTPAFKRMVLADEQLSESGYTIKQKEQDSLVGTIGIALSDLRPAGKIEIGDEVYDAVTEGGFIDMGSTVKVLKNEGYSLIVRQV